MSTNLGPSPNRPSDSPTKLSERKSISIPKSRMSAAGILESVKTPTRHSPKSYRLSPTSNPPSTVSSQMATSRLMQHRLIKDQSGIIMKTESQLSWTCLGPITALNGKKSHTLESSMDMEELTVLTFFVITCTYLSQSKKGNSVKNIKFSFQHEVSLDSRIWEMRKDLQRAIIHRKARQVWILRYRSFL